MKKIRIETMEQLESFVKKSTNVDHIEKVVSTALKVCFIFIGNPSLEQVKKKVIDFIQKYCYENAGVERPLFICFGWDLNYFDEAEN
jgi:hypothetical protein